jgi:hypothetical protein
LRCAVGVRRLIYGLASCFGSTLGSGRLRKSCAIALARLRRRLKVPCFSHLNFRFWEIGAKKILPVAVHSSQYSLADADTARRQAGAS